MLSQLVLVFSKFGFVIDWTKGMTEIICKYGGKAAAVHKHQAFVCDSAQIPLPAIASAAYVSIVDMYKSHRSVISDNSSFFSDAVRRASLTLDSFAPIARRVFRSGSVALGVTLMLFASLICLRLSATLSRMSLAATAPLLRCVSLTQCTGVSCEVLPAKSASVSARPISKLGCSPQCMLYRSETSPNACSISLTHD